MEGVEIRKVSVMNPNDERGESYKLFTNEQGVQIILCKRRKGTISGNHYHKGEDASKNPEKLYLISGKAILDLYNGLTGERLSVKIEGGTEVRIYPHILHKFKALDDIVFLEYRSTVLDDNNKDSYPAESYEDYINQLKND